MEKVTDLSHTTICILHERLITLKTMVARHNTGDMPLNPEALKDYKNDILILKHLLGERWQISTLLGDAINWISSNMNPKDVFSEDDLKKWAFNNYLKREDCVICPKCEHGFMTDESLEVS
jgi:hypothetical protein